MVFVSNCCFTGLTGGFLLDGYQVWVCKKCEQAAGTLEVQEVMVDYPVSVNRIYRRLKKGVVLTKKAAEYKAYTAWKFKRLTKLYDKPVQLIVELYSADKRVRDIDNGMKILFDAIEHSGVIDNDFQIKKLVVTSHVGAEKAYARVLIAELYST